MLQRHRYTAALAALGLYACTPPNQAPANPSMPPSPPVIGSSGSSGPAVQDTPSRVLSDADLVAYAKSDYDKRAMMGRHIVLGRHHDAAVVAEFPCSDVCPDYTTRIIHYDVGPGAPCDAIGGATVTRAVPYSIAVIEKQFCVPTVIAKP